jgi:hypothetical protein
MEPCVTINTTVARANVSVVGKKCQRVLHYVDVYIFDEIDLLGHKYTAAFPVTSSCRLVSILHTSLAHGYYTG